LRGQSSRPGEVFKTLRDVAVTWLKRAVPALAIALSVALLIIAPVSGCSDCSTEITTTALPDAIVGVFYSFPLDSDCGGDDWFLGQGNLPPGIGLNVDGQLSGVPTSAGTFGFTVGVIDFGSGEQAFKGLSLTVLDTP